MFEKLRIRLFGRQPTPNITDKLLDRLIQRDYPNDFHDVKKKLGRIDSDSQKGKNRFSAAVLKLSDGDLTKIDTHIKMCNNDFRNVVMQAEYPRVYKDDFAGRTNNEERKTYIDDWTDYSNWLEKQ